MPRRPARTLAAVLAAPLVAALAAGCAPSAPAETADPAAAPATRVFAADNGDITIPAEPQRVVATGYAVPVLLEADAPLVGISLWSRGTALMSEEDLATYEETPKVAGDQAAATDYEAVAAAEPDLIVIGVPAPVLGDIDMAQLEAIAPVVAIGPTLPDAWRELSRRQSDAAGRLAEFDAARTAYEERAAELTEEYAAALEGLQFGHLGGYGQVDSGSFHREFSGSWGTNIAEDMGVTYYGQVAQPGPGSAAVSEYPSLEQVVQSFAEADAITYTVGPDGTPPEPVQVVLDSPLWQSLPAVQAGMVFPLRFTEAATYESATRAIDAAAESLAPLLSR